jgi:hypothetical protein
MSLLNSFKNSLFRCFLYTWAAPATAIGCCIGVFALCYGATWNSVGGVVEIGGGRLSSLVRLLPSALRFEAITLGHIILGMNHSVLETHRLHEHTHVRQYEHWGLLFFPLYLGSSLLQLLRGRDPHTHNYFEQKAYLNAFSADVICNTDKRLFSYDITAP